MKILKLLLFFLFVGQSYGQDQVYPISRYYEYGKTVFEVKCLGLPDFQIDESGIKYQEVFEFEASQKQLHGIALKYIGEFYKSAKSVIDVNDSDNGLIIVKGTLNRPYSRYYRKDKMKSMTLETSHNLTFEIKKNRMRVTIDNFNVIINGSLPGKIEEFIEGYHSKDVIKGNEDDFRFKANIGIPLNIIHNDFSTFLNGVNSYFKNQLNDDW